MVVSQDNASDIRERSQSSVDGTNSTADVTAGSSVLEQDTDDEGPILFNYARNEAWDKLLHRLEITPSEVIHELTYPTDGDNDERNSLLHTVAVMERVPIKVVESILVCASSRQSATMEGGVHSSSSSSSSSSPSSSVLSCTSLAAKQNHLKQTPLHLAVDCMPERTDVIECLYRACPECALARDSLQLRPIDLITQKIIMMEEVIKYSIMNEEDDSRIKEDESRINSLWQTVGVLVGALSTRTRQDCNTAETNDGTPAFLVHACLRSKEVPFALTERAVKANKEQLATPDSNGDLPLHVVARIPPPVRCTGARTSSTIFTFRDRFPYREDIEDNDDDDVDFIERVIKLHPQGAFHFNHEHQIPLMVAIQSGRKWNSGIRSLLQVNPGGIEEIQIPLNIFPILLELIGRHPSTMYQVLQSQPGLFLYSCGQTFSSGITSSR